MFAGHVRGPKLNYWIGCKVGFIVSEQKKINKTLVIDACVIDFFIVHELLADCDSSDCSDTCIACLTPV